MAVIKRIGIVLTSVLFIFALSELYFRITFKEELKDQHSPLIYSPDPLTGYRYIPNSEGDISKPGITAKRVRINNQGFFTADFSTHKKPGTYRIVFVGSSATSGIWMDGTVNFSTKLQQMLDASPNKNIEIINCSLDGQGLGAGLMDIVKSRVVNFEPDLVMLELNIPVSIGSMQRIPYKGYLLQYYTDSTKKLAMNAVDELNEHWFFRFCYDYSYTFRAWCKDYVEKHKQSRKAKLMRTYKDRISRMEDVDVGFFKFNKSIDLLKETQDSVTSKTHAKLVFFSFDSDPQKLTPYLKENGLTAIFLKCALEKKHLSLPDTHLNQSGHAVVADSFYNVLIRNNFFR